MSSFPSKLLSAEFQGKKFRLADNWRKFVPQDPSKPIKQAEIGTFHGANLLSVASSYGIHPDSRFFAIDPWIDYDQYPEQKNKQPSIQETCMKNLDSSEHKSKIQIMRGFSHEQLPLLENDSFDIIQIDGNHQPEFVLEDAVLSFRKLKVGGQLIFDDYGWGGPDLTKRGIDSFLQGFRDRIQKLGLQQAQYFVKRKN